tara:strand:- start:150 stop:305 length:156 start_codon:yes stop_codon:yes gene_type:complete
MNYSIDILEKQKHQLENLLLRMNENFQKQKHDLEQKIEDLNNSILTLKQTS